MQLKEQQYYSEQEYLNREVTASFRSEYYNGEIFPMAGGTPNHNRIALNLSSALNFAFRGQAYDVFMSDMRLWIPRWRLYTYPDVMIVAGQVELAEERKDTIVNPIAIAEVLSASTSKYDRVGKFKLYRSIPSLREYVLLSQTEFYVEQYSKTDEQKWVLSEYEGEDAVLNLTSVPFQSSLTDIYNKVEFDSIISE